MRRTQTIRTASALVAVALAYVWWPSAAMSVDCDGMYAVSVYCPRVVKHCDACSGKYNPNRVYCRLNWYETLGNPRADMFRCDGPSERTPNQVCAIKVIPLPPGQQGPPAPYTADCVDECACDMDGVFQFICFPKDGTTKTVQAQVYYTSTGCQIPN